MFNNWFPTYVEGIFHLARSRMKSSPSFMYSMRRTDMTCAEDNSPKPAVGERVSRRQTGIFGQQRNMDDIDESALRLKGSILWLCWRIPLMLFELPQRP